MAIQRLTIDGYGQVELNNVAFRRDGRIEAQCKLSETDFASVPAENGMLLAVDNIHRIVKFPVSGEEFPIALHYSAEHLYDERAQGLKNFKLGLDEFLPRLGYLSRGDKFTSNTICYNTSEYADDDALKEAIAGVAEDGADLIYGTQSANGAILVTATKPTEGVKLIVRRPFTMPDGQYAIQFQAL